jgi:hypothetical protein
MDGTELHLASFCLADAELCLEGADDPAFAALKVTYANVLGGAPPGMPPDCGMELELETGNTPMPRSRPVMPRSRPVKRLSEGELAELRAPCSTAAGFSTRRRDKRRRWCSRASRGASATTTGASTPSRARRSNPFRTWTLCLTARGGSRFFTKLDLASG